MAKYWIILNGSDEVIQSYISDDDPSPAPASPWQEITSADYAAYIAERDGTEGGVVVTRNAEEDYTAVVASLYVTVNRVTRELFTQAEIDIATANVASHGDLEIGRYSEALRQEAVLSGGFVDLLTDLMGDYLDYLSGTVVNGKDIEGGTGSIVLAGGRKATIQANTDPA